MDVNDKADGIFGPGAKVDIEVRDIGPRLAAFLEAHGNANPPPPMKVYLTGGVGPRFIRYSPCYNAITFAQPRHPMEGDPRHITRLFAVGDTVADIISIFDILDEPPQQDEAYRTLALANKLGEATIRIQIEEAIRTENYERAGYLHTLLPPRDALGRYTTRPDDT